jgi:hypothetical protein
MKQIHKREDLRLMNGFNLIYAKGFEILCTIIKLGQE